MLKTLSVSSPSRLVSMTRAAAVGTVAAMACFHAPSAARAQDNMWVRPGASGNLLYTMDSRGDRILDFSQVGYGSGIVPLPDYSDVVTPDRIITVAPAAGDSHAAIQAAIDQVQALSFNEHGFRGVVQLQAGTYDISDTLRITESGVILRGMGKQRSGGTVLAWTATDPIPNQHEPFMIQVGSANAFTIDTATTRSVIDKVVPTGAMSLRVDSTAGFQAGDHVLIERRPNEAWVDALGMRDFGDGDPDWDPDDPLFHSQYERRITHVDHERGRIFFDAPVAQALEQRYGTATVSHVENHRINNVGIENLRGDGQKIPTHASDLAHANTFIYFDAVENSWARSIAGEHLARTAVRFETTSKYNTLVDGEFTDPVAPVTSPWLYPFWMDGQLNMMRDMYVENGRHAFVSNRPSRGPNVFLNGVAVSGHNDSGPHRQYSTGTLYDNISDDHSLNVRNRFAYGTRHGWAGGNIVIWNSQADRFIVQNPPDGQNWLIGSTGTYQSNFNGNYPAYVDAHGTRQTLNSYESLYLAQLAQRMANPDALVLEYWVGDFDEYQYSPDDDDNLADAQWVQKLSQAFASEYAIGSMDGLASQYAYDATKRIVPVTIDFDVPEGYVPISAVLTIATAMNFWVAENRLILLENVDLENAIDVGDLAFLPSFDVNPYTDTDIVILEFLADDLEEGLGFLMDGQLDLAVLGSQRTDWVDLQVTFVPAIPEPATLSLLALGGMIAFRRPRRQV